MPTCRPANSWPWQNGQCATTVPNSSSSPDLSGKGVDHPGREHHPASPDHLAAERHDETARGRRSAATDVTASSRKVTVSYAASSLRAAARNSAGGVPSWVTTLCMCRAGSLR